VAGCHINMYEHQVLSPDSWSVSCVGLQRCHLAITAMNHVNTAVQDVGEWNIYCSCMLHSCVTNVSCCVFALTCLEVHWLPSL